jgi:hypothetical protein
VEASRVRIDRRLVGLGLFLVTAGAVMLAAREGLIPEGLAGRAWTLWPLLLVGAGLSIVLAGRPGASLGGLLVAVTLGAMLGGVAATGWSGGFGACTGNRAGTPFAEQTGSITPGASVSIAISCGDLDVSTGPGTDWSLAGSSAEGDPPAISTPAGGLRVENADRAGFDFGGGRNDWRVVLPNEPGFRLDVQTNGGSSAVALDGARVSEAAFETNAGSLTIDLRGVADIGDLDVHTNLGSTTVRLPEHRLSGSIAVNAGSVALCAPSTVGLRVELDTVAGSADLGSHGLVESGDGVWETPDYAAAAVQLELRVDVNAGSLTLDPVRECAG